MDDSNFDSSAACKHAAMTDDEEIARSRACIGRSEELIVRQRTLVSKLIARGKLADPLAHLLDRMEANLRVMQKVHRSIETRQPSTAKDLIVGTKRAHPIANNKIRPPTIASASPRRLAFDG